jgi:hypothetical protein
VPPADHQDPLGGAEDHLHVVLAEQDGQRPLIGDAPDQLHRPGGLLGGHAGGRLVEQEQLGLHGERDGELEGTLVPVGQVAGPLVCEGREPTVVQDGGDRVGVPTPHSAEGAGGLTLLGEPAELHVPGHRQPREDAGDLEGTGDTGLGDRMGRLAGDVLPVEGDGAGVRCEVARH